MLDTYRHACQIPQKLAERLILSCTQPDDIVLILFGGSGSEIDICRRLGRQFISAELDPEYHALIQDRLNTGHIDDKYRLTNRDDEPSEQSSLQLSLFE